MRFIFMLGGLIGFVLAGGSSWLADCGADRVLLDGVLGCLVGALLFRWFWSVLLTGVRETIALRHQAQVAAEAAKRKP
jgi:hypothetical protein